MDPMTNYTPTPNPGVVPDQNAGFNPATQAAAMPQQPVQPVQTPVTPSAQPVAPIAQPATPFNPTLNGGAPVFQNTGGGFGATDPITMPEPAPEPDPIEEELKAPFRAAGPVPGSIGSAISMPAQDGSMPGTTPSVAFNDPATESPLQASTQARPVKKNNKSTLMILCIIAGIIVLALGAVLVMQLMGML